MAKEVVIVFERAVRTSIPDDAKLTDEQLKKLGLYIWNEILELKDIYMVEDHIVGLFVDPVDEEPDMDHEQIKEVLSSYS